MMTMMMMIYTPVVEDPVFEAKVALILLCVPLEKSQVNCDFVFVYLCICIFVFVFVYLHLCICICVFVFVYLCI